MTNYLDAATVGTVTTPSGTDVVASVDSATIASITTPSISELTSGVDAATIKSVTTPISGELTTYHVHTFDYNWAAWNTTYTFDSQYTIAGSVGHNDTDNGIL